MINVYLISFPYYCVSGANAKTINACVRASCAPNFYLCALFIYSALCAGIAPEPIWVFLICAYVKLVIAKMNILKIT